MLQNARCQWDRTVTTNPGRAIRDFRDNMRPILANAWLQQEQLSPDEGWLLGFHKGFKCGFDDLFQVFVIK